MAKRAQVIKKVSSILRVGVTVMPILCRKLMVMRGVVPPIPQRNGGTTLPMICILSPLIYDTEVERDSHCQFLCCPVPVCPEKCQLCQHFPYWKVQCNNKYNAFKVNSLHETINCKELASHAVELHAMTANNLADIMSPYVPSVA